MLSIKSTSSNRELQIRRGQGGYFIVEILGHRVAAQTEVWIDDDAPSLGRFFTDLGAKKHLGIALSNGGHLKAIFTSLSLVHRLGV